MGALACLPRGMVLGGVCPRPVALRTSRVNICPLDQGEGCLPDLVGVCPLGQEWEGPLDQEWVGPEWDQERVWAVGWARLWVPE